VSIKNFRVKLIESLY